MKTSFKKVMAGATVVAIVAMNMTVVSAAQIGTGTITGSGFTSAINYDSTTLQASGSVGPITVSALVAPTLDMTISSGSLNLGTLSTSAVNTQSFDVSISTNSTNGATVGVTSSAPGLVTGSGDTIGFTGSVLSNGSGAGYNLTVTGAIQSSGDLPTITTTLVSTASSNEILKVINPSQNAKVTVSANAAINALTPAGSYSVVHTFTVTGSF